jgi:hypothetical protein
MRFWRGKRPTPVVESAKQSSSAIREDASKVSSVPPPSPSAAALSEDDIPDTDQFRKPFWASVFWPWKEIVLILVLGPLAFFLLGSYLMVSRNYGLLFAAIVFPVLALSWVLHRVLKVWADWPAKRRWVRWLKTAVRLLLTDH